MYDTTVPVHGRVYGEISGWAEGYATSYENFLEVLQNGEGDVVIDWNDRVDAELYDVDWEIDDDSAMERTIDDADDYNEDDMEEFLNRVSIG